MARERDLCRWHYTALTQWQQQQRLKRAREIEAKLRKLTAEHLGPGADPNLLVRR